MSQVTNLIFTFSTLEDEEDKIRLVNHYEGEYTTMNLVSADYNSNRRNEKKWYGGTKFLECPLFIGAFNYLDLDDFLAFLRKIEWEFPDHVQLMVKEQNDERFRLINVFEG